MLYYILQIILMLFKGKYYHRAKLYVYLCMYVVIQQMMGFSWT